MTTLDEFNDEMDRIEPEMKSAYRAGDVATFVRLSQVAFEVVPDAPADRRKVLGFFAWVARKLVIAGQFAEAQRWLPLVQETYGPDDEEPRFIEAVVEWQIGDRPQGKRLLQDLYRDEGELPFRTDPRYMAIARDEGDELPPRPGPDAVSVEDPRIYELADRVNTAMDADEYHEVIDAAREALRLLGEPRSVDGAMWFLASAGDAYFLQGYFSRALEVFTQARQALGGHSNPFVLLRLGECLVELDRDDEAVEHLLGAYMQAPEIVAGQPDKYLDVLRERDLI